MKILLCSVPDGSLDKTLQPLIPRRNEPLEEPWLPFGILRVLSWMEKKGYSGDLFDINNLRQSDETLIKNFKQINPSVVGLSGILSHCYPNVKRITKILRKLFPDVWIIVGGHLTGSSNVVLRKTEADICVIGDGEIPFVKLLDYIKLHPTRRQTNYSELCKIKGLAFIDENHQLKTTGYAEQLPGSEMQNPDLDKLRLGLQKFGGNGELIHEFFEPISKILTNWGFGPMLDKMSPDGLKIYKKNINKRIGTVFSSKGCVARCTFCQRATKGYSVYAPNVFETHIIELKDKYNVGAIKIYDENFGSNRRQSYEIARIMKKHDILWFPLGVRVSSCTYDDLKFYKEHNMVAVRFSIESGSQKILDIMEKKFTLEDVYNAFLNCKKLGVGTTVDQLVTGMPGETVETILESSKFTASLRYLLGRNWNATKPFLAMAIPGTPLYEYCQQIGTIGTSLDEEEDYLIRTSEHTNKSILNYVNKTNSSIKEIHYWKYLHVYAVKKAYLDLIIKNNIPIKHKLLQIYKDCIKAVFIDMVAEFNHRKDFYKNIKLIQKIKWHASFCTNFLLSFSVLFLPKAVLFSMVRAYANLRFYFLKKNNKLIKGNQRYNLFVENRDYHPASNFRFTENRIAKASRKIDRSLRTVVMENSRQMKPAITDEEKNLQIIAQGQ